MNDHRSHLTTEFIASQKIQLQEALAQLTSNSRASASEERQLQNNSLNRSEGSGDDAQKTTLRDNDAARFEHNVGRLSAIRRALEKIEDGTYGLSDESGKPIPKARLEAVPESVLTVEESAASEVDDRI
jgi:DnaK suppressor protein